MDDQAGVEPTADGSNAWAVQPRNLLVVGAIVFALLALLALASAIDLPSRESAASLGDIELGAGGDLDIRPIPGCPGGFTIGEDIYVVPDPEACGFRAVEPGELGLDDSGKILVVPGRGGSGEGIGGFRVGPDGSVELVPPSELGPDDFRLELTPDGTFELARPDGSGLDIVPGDDGLSLRDRASGNAEFVPAPGSDFGPGQNQPGGQIDSDEQGLDDPSSLDPPGRVESNSDASAPSLSNDSDSTDWSGIFQIVLVLLGLGFAGFVIYALGSTEWRRSDKTEVEDEPEHVQDDLVDYAAEISALDRLLWEIDQETDPRRAIQRVYAALETGLDNPQMARRRSETPGIYLQRVLGHFTSLHTPLQELTTLFEHARFSEHEITAEMRERAVAALVAVRAQYSYAHASDADDSKSGTAHTETAAAAP